MISVDFDHLATEEASLSGFTLCQKPADLKLQYFQKLDIDYRVMKELYAHSSPMWLILLKEASLSVSSQFFFQLNMKNMWYIMWNQALLLGMAGN